MTVRVEPATLEALQHIVQHLRAIDRDELLATTVGDDLSSLPGRIMQFCIMSFVAADEAPIAAWGIRPMWPGVCTVWAFGTDDWDRALMPMTRHGREFMIPTLLKQGYHRIECRSLADREDTARWLRLFGATPEATLRCYGKSGENFTLYRRVDYDLRQATPQYWPAAGDD